MLQPPQITVITVSYFSVPFIRNLLKNLSEKAACPEKIKYLIVDNTFGADPEVGELGALGKNITVMENHVHNHRRGSRSHAAGLNFACSKISSDYILVVDPDVYVFKQNWDEFLINELKTGNTNAIGTTYPEWWLGAYHNFTNPIFSFFDLTKFKEMEPDWTPFTENPALIFLNLISRQIVRGCFFMNRNNYMRFRTLRKLFKTLESCLPVCSLDTGWRIARQAKKKNLAATLFRAVLPEEVTPVLPGPASAFLELARQYELYGYKNEFILTHKYSTSSWVWKTPRGKDGEYWLQCVKEANGSNHRHPRPEPA